MGETNVNTGGGNIIGSAIGKNAQVTAEKIIANIRQQVPAAGSDADKLKAELVAVLAAAREQLAKEDLKPKVRAEAEATVDKIEAELTEPEPDGDLVKGWLGTLDAVSSTVGKVLRAAGAIAGLIG
jgi:hypothetical protein